jgi:hypothetical protein
MTLNISIYIDYYYAECHLCLMSFMLNVIYVTLHHAQCRNADCRYAECRGTLKIGHVGVLRVSCLCQKVTKWCVCVVLL